MSDTAVAASAKGATFLILVQIGSRASTFTLNQILLRFLSPALLGASVQLELFAISTLYFARESFRVAAQRRSDGGIQAAVNLSYLALLAGPPIGVALAFLYLGTGLPDVRYLRPALWAHLLAVVVELLSEPAYVAVEQAMVYKIRAAAEATAIVAKTLATAGTAFWSSRVGVDVGVLPFAAGELAWAVVLTAVYFARVAPLTGTYKFALTPTKIQSSHDSYVLSLWSKSLLSLSFSLYVQTAIKYVLTQGDSILIATLATLEEQGMYALSANYGGLIARMLFRPIEDSSRNLFAQLCNTNSDSELTSKETGKGASAFSKPHRNVQQAATILADILRLYSMASVIIFAVGPYGAPLLLRLVAGSRWSSTGAGEVLGTYCYYIPLLAINGVTEAFVAATASTSDLRRQSLWMAGFFGGFAGAAYLFLRVLGLGAEGVVLANCVNMLLRIVFNLRFISQYFADRQAKFENWSALPRMYALGAVPVIGQLLKSTSLPDEQFRHGLLGKLVLVAGTAITFAIVVLILDRRVLIANIRNFTS